MPKGCQHGAVKGHCVMCDPRIHMILRCKKCAKRGGGQTWHAVVNDIATCRRCGTERPALPRKKDIKIRNR